MSKRRITHAGFDRPYAAAAERGRERMAREPRAVAARYDYDSGRVVVKLSNGCAFMFLAEIAQGLRGAPPELLAEVELDPLGFGLRWKKLDADFTVTGLLAGRFGTARRME